MEQVGQINEFTSNKIYWYAITIINDCIAETYGLNDINKSDVLDVFFQKYYKVQGQKVSKNILYIKVIDFIEKEKYTVTNIIERH